MSMISIAGFVLTVVFGLLGLYGVRLQMRRLTWRKIMRGIAGLEAHVRDFGPDVIIAVSDGLIPAGIISTNLGISECYFVNLPIHRNDRGERIIPDVVILCSLEAKRVLIVDDHLYSGANLAAVVDFVAPRAAAYKTLVIFKHMQENQLIVPDWHAFTFSGGVQGVPWSFTSEHRRTHGT